MKIDNIIWDWNGTIVRDAFLFVDIMNTLLQEKGLPKISLQTYKNRFCFPITKYWKSLGFRFSASSFQTMNNYFIHQYQTRMFEPSLQPGIKSVLQHIKNKNINQFILSASENSLLQASVIHYRLEDFFTDVVGVNNLHALGKGSLARSLFNKYNLEPQRTLLVGDTQYDMEVAKELGCKLLMVSYGHFSRHRLLASGEAVVGQPKDVLLYV